MDREDDFDLSDITIEDQVMEVFEENEWGTRAEVAVGGGRDSNIGELIDIELVRLKDQRFLKVGFVNKARQTTPLMERGRLIREGICKFIEDGEADFARLRAAIENKSSFNIICNAAIGIRKAAYRIGAKALWSLADGYRKYSESDNRSRGELLPEYQVMKNEFNEIKNDFRANILKLAHTAEARLVNDPPVPLTDPSIVDPPLATDPSAGGTSHGSVRHSSRG